MYKSKLSNIIDHAVVECIQCGSGSSEYKQYSILTEWSENEKDIVVYVLEYGSILFEFIEKDVLSHV